MKVALLACSKRKAGSPKAVRFFYLGATFTKSIRYALPRFDRVLVLSAKYGLLELKQIIEPYDLTLRDMDPEARLAWARKVRGQMREAGLLKPGVVLTYLTGMLYSEGLPEGKYPWHGLTMGQRLQWLNKKNQPSLFSRD